MRTGPLVGRLSSEQTHGCTAASDQKHGPTSLHSFRVNVDGVCYGPDKYVNRIKSIYNGGKIDLHLSPRACLTNFCKCNVMTRVLHMRMPSVLQTQNEASVEDEMAACNDSEVSAVLEQLVTHIPDMVVYRAHNAPLPQTIHSYGVVMFADISGKIALHYIA